jgi:hypothetical protein
MIKFLDARRELGHSPGSLPWPGTKSHTLPVFQHCGKMRKENLEDKDSEVPI